MHWRFWHRPMSEGSPANRTGSKLPKAKELPHQIGRHLVVRKKLNPDYVWALRCVERPRPEQKGSFDFRLFDPVEAQANHCRVVDYTTLDACPCLIRHSGRYHRTTFEVDLDPEVATTPAVEPSPIAGVASTITMAG